MSATPLPEPEFSRFIDIRHIDDRLQTLVATPQECAALARRFSLVSMGNLAAHLTLSRDGAAITATGRLEAAIVQPCAISAEDLKVRVSEPLSLRFIPDTALPGPEEEIELTEDACDEIPFSGDRFDLGEAVAQSLALAIDPFATGPDAERVRREAGLLGEGQAGPFAALAALKGKKPQ
jgi:uncharacterized metal-binding protein YceD (DUF177 family)